MASIPDSCQQFFQHLRLSFKIAGGLLSRLSVLLVMLLSLFLLLESSKYHPRISDGASSIMLALKLDVKLYPCRNTSGLSRHSREVPLPLSYKLKAGLHILNATLAASCLVLLAGDVSPNPGPVGGRIPTFTSACGSDQAQSADISSLVQELPCKGLNLCHYNVGSLTNKLDQIKLLLASVSERNNGKPNLLLGISETFLEESWSNASLAAVNYITFRADRPCGKGGGLLIYVPSHLPVTRRFDLEMEGIECIWLELKFPRTKPCLVSFIYRPPSSDVSYLDQLDTMLTKVDCEGNHSVILGDFNFDFLCRTSVSKRFTNLFKSMNYQQLITIPTRPVSGTLLDLIFTTHKENVLNFGTLPISISDHLPVFVSLKSRDINSKSSGHKSIFFRSLKNFSVDKFLADLECLPWNSLDMLNDVNDSLGQWYCLFNSVIDLHAPLIKRRVKRQLKPEWFSAEIGTAIKNRNNLHSQAILRNTASCWCEYRIARNRVVHLIRNAKRTFYRDSINSNLDNPKNLWKIIRDIAPSKCSNLPSHLTINGKIYNDPFDISNLFNEHFANITASVQLPTPAPESSNLNYLTDFVNSKLPNDISFSIPLVTEDFVLSSLKHLSSGKAAGLDGLNSYFFKIAASSIAPSLKAIFNLSLSSGIFPDLWKIAKVSPLFKDGSLFDRSNFRPISVLATVSKVLERHVHSSFYNFLVEYDLLTDSQFGFRKFRSCELAVTDLTDKILSNMDTRQLNGLLLIDLKKAFDLVDHNTLICKLRIYGCASPALDWFQSYLTGRYQRTIFKGTLSNKLPLSIGIPQGSILGPLFFLLFINDLPLQLPPDTNSTMFADDTTILVSGSSVCDISSELNHVAMGVSAWADQNRMALNRSKTKSLLITTPQKSKVLSDLSLNVTIGGKLIEQVDHAKILGVTLDAHLTWDKHVDNICNKISSRLSLLRRIKPFLTYDCTLRFYNSCIHNHFIYCSTAWGNCSHTLLLRLLRLQKRAARIILSADFSQPSVSLFSKLKWITITDLIKCRKLLLLFNILINPDTPLCFKHRFKFLSNTRVAGGRRTRASLFDLCVPFPRANSGKRTFAYSAATLFNGLCADFKQLASFPVSTLDSLSFRQISFKRKLRSFFLQQPSSVQHLEELICYDCRFLLRCNCISN